MSTQVPIIGYIFSSSPISAIKGDQVKGSGIISGFGVGEFGV